MSRHIVGVWQEWIEDEQRLASTTKDRNNILKLYELALKDYLGTYRFTFLSFSLSLGHPFSLTTVASCGFSTISVD